MTKRSNVPAHALLKEKRVAANLSQPELAAAVGCSVAAVSRWESDDERMRRKPDLPNALKLKEVLKLNPAMWV